MKITITCTPKELIEGCAQALQREVCRTLSVRHAGKETDDERWKRRWDQTHEGVKDNYRREAAAVLKAAGVLR